MTPLEQANALLKAAEEATAAPWEHSDCGAVNSANNQPDWMDWSNNGEELFVGGPPLNQRKAADAAFIALARNTAPAIASALLEKHQALEEACELLRYFERLHNVPAGMSAAPATYGKLKATQAFLARQGE